MAIQNPQDIIAHSSTGVSIGAFGISFTITDFFQVIALIVSIVAGVAAYRLSTARREYIEAKKNTKSKND